MKYYIVNVEKVSKEDHTLNVEAIIVDEPEWEYCIFVYKNLTFENLTCNGEEENSKGENGFNIAISFNFELLQHKDHQQNDIQKATERGHELIEQIVKDYFENTLTPED